MKQYQYNPLLKIEALGMTTASRPLNTIFTKTGRTLKKNHAIRSAKRSLSDKIDIFNNGVRRVNRATRRQYTDNNPLTTKIMNSAKDRLRSLRDKLNIPGLDIAQGNHVVNGKIMPGMNYNFNFM